MTSFQKYTDVFIVRIWREPQEVPSPPEGWRGVIEHVASKEKLYFRHLEAMTDFIASNARIEPKQVESTDKGERGNVLHRLLTFLRLRERRN